MPSENNFNVGSVSKSSAMCSRENKTGTNEGATALSEEIELAMAYLGNPNYFSKFDNLILGTFSN